MLKKWIRGLIKWVGDDAAPAKVEVLPPDPTIKPGHGFYSTTLHSRAGARDGESLSAYLMRTGSQVFQRGHEHVETVHMSVAMDGAVDVRPAHFAMDDWEGGNVKGIFSLSGGSPVPDAQIDWYASQSFIGYQMCALMAQHWFIDKACSMPARDAIRNGYEITRDDGEKMPPDVADYLKKLDKRFKVKSNCVEAVRKMRMFGIRVVLFEVKSADPDYYLKPFNPDGVTPGSYKGMSQVDPYWITPELDFRASSDPASQHFYEPTYWRINGKRYHRSHLVVMKTNEVPDVLKPTYFYGGIPLPQRIYERVYAAERTTNEAPQLALTKRATYIHVDLEAAAANEGELTEKLLEWRYFLDNFGVKVLGKEETAEQFDTALNDLDETIMTQWQLSCSIAGVPSTKMLGTAPKGFNATGEYEESNYHEELESVQELDMAPVLERHHLLCIRSYVVPKFKVAPFETSVEFEELDAETGKEAAERTKMEADRDLALAQAGAIDGIDIRARLIKQKDSGYTGIEAAMPEGPEPASVVQPGATKEQPNQPPGTTPAPAAPPAPGAVAQDMMEAAVALARAYELLAA